jgi:hypothetical protein
MDMVTHGEVRPWFSVNVPKTIDVLELILPWALQKHIEPEGRSFKHH